MAVAELPDDVDALKAMVVAMAEQRALLEARTRHLQAANKTADERIATLTAIERMLGPTSGSVLYEGKSVSGTRGASARRCIERRAACLRVRRNQYRHVGDRS